MRLYLLLVAFLVAVSAAGENDVGETASEEPPALPSATPPGSRVTPADLTEPLTELSSTGDPGTLLPPSVPPVPAPAENEVGDDEMTDPRTRYSPWPASNSSGPAQELEADPGPEADDDDEDDDGQEMPGSASIVPIGVMQLPPARLPPPALPLPPKHTHGYQGRYGPFFEDGPGTHNVTARVGSTVMLDCKIGMLQDKTVTWLHRRGETIHLLTVGSATYSSDQRIALRLRYPNNWRLEITHVSTRDQGIYECQVATHPIRVRTVFLRVTAPKVVIVDEEGHTVTERYYKAGSAVELTCVARQIETPGDTLLWWRGSKLLSSGISVNASAGPGAVSSTLTLQHSQKRDSGNYTCTVGAVASASVSVHVLNGDNPEAVHDGNSGVTSGRVTMWLLAFLQCTQMLTSAR